MGVLKFRLRSCGNYKDVFYRFLGIDIILGMNLSFIYLEFIVVLLFGD